MTDSMALRLAASRLVTDSITITVSYDKANLDDPEKMKHYTGSFSTDHYGRKVPRHAHGTKDLGRHTLSSSVIIEAVTQLFTRLADDSLLIRHLNLTANNVEQEGSAAPRPLQLDIFTTYEAIEQKRKQEVKQREREQRLQKARLKINQRYGKNAILKGLNFDEGATGIERNQQIGGHKA
jgi:DNA polymerase V